MSTIVAPTPKSGTSKLPLPSASMLSAIKRANMKNSTAVAAIPLAASSSSAVANERMSAYPQAIVELLNLNRVSICDDDQEKKDAQKQTVQQWIEQGKKGACPNNCPSTYKWYVGNTTKKIVKKNGKSVEGGYISQFPFGHLRITRWNAFGQRCGREDFYDALGHLYHSIEWTPCNRTVQHGSQKIKINCERVGNEMFYDARTGQVSRIVPWVAGPMVDKIVKNKSNGKKKTIQVRRASRIHGIEQIFTPFINRTITWQNGKRHGAECATYVRTGVTLCERTWVAGQAEGSYICKFRNGQMSQQMYFVLGRMQGDQVSYFRNGHVRSVVPYWGGKRHGTELNTVVTAQQDGLVKHDTTQQHWCKGEIRASAPPANLFEACAK